jgi:hypothetical protein
VDKTLSFTEKRTEKKIIKGKTDEGILAYLRMKGKKDCKTVELGIGR